MGLKTGAQTGYTGTNTKRKIGLKKALRQSWDTNPEDEESRHAESTSDSELCT